MPILSVGKVATRGWCSPRWQLVFPALDDLRHPVVGVDGIPSREVKDPLSPRKRTQVSGKGGDRPAGQIEAGSQVREVLLRLHFRVGYGHLLGNIPSEAIEDLIHPFRKLLQARLFTAIGNPIQGRVQLLQIPGERLVDLEGGPNRDQHGQVSGIHSRVQKLPNGSLAPLRRVQVHGLEIQQENDVAALTPLLNLPDRTSRAGRRISRSFSGNLSLFQA